MFAAVNIASVPGGAVILYGFIPNLSVYFQRKCFYNESRARWRAVLAQMLTDMPRAPPLGELAAPNGVD